MTTDNTKLKPCPCCGCLANIHKNNRVFADQSYENYGTQAHGFRIECEGECHLMTCWWHTKKQAIEAWNRRAT